MRRANNSTDLYFFLISIIFLLVGGFALMNMYSAYSMDKGQEGVGFRQAALLETYSRADEFLLYSVVTARFSLQEGMHQYYLDSMQPAFEEERCGRIGEYAAWNAQGASCFREGLWEDEGLWAVLVDSFENAWSHPTTNAPLMYRFSAEPLTNNQVRVSAQSLESLFLPIVGVRGGVADGAYAVAEQDRFDQPARRTFTHDSELAVTVVVDPASIARNQNPDRIVIHYTAGSTAQGAINTLLRSRGLSAHYVVDRDGSITQMVDESRVAYHAGGCGEDACAITGMNSRSVGVEIVNLGWQRPGDLAPATPIGEGVCREGYVYGQRDCSYASYQHRPQDLARCELFRQEFFCWQEYPSEQLAQVVKLTAEIAHRWNIPVDRTHLLTHEEIKVDKSDPGPAFPWYTFLREVQQEVDRLKSLPEPEREEEPAVVLPEEEGGQEEVVEQEPIPSQQCFSQTILTSYSEDSGSELTLTKRNLENNDLVGLISAAEIQYELPRGLLKGTITQESRGNPFAISPTGCSGIAQFCYSTARASEREVGNYFDARTVQACRCNQGGPCTIEDSSCSRNDHRFEARRAIPAAAHYLKWIYDHPAFRNFRSDEQKLIYLTAQAYNTGPTAVGRVARDCEAHNDFDNFVECVEDKVKPNPAAAEKHARHVLNYMVAWGGELEGLSQGVMCQGLDVKGLGRLLFKPDFEVVIPDAITPYENLVSWAQGVVENTNNNLQEVPGLANTAPQGWSISHGFCGDERDTLNNNVVLSLQECLDNEQEGCGCTALLPEGFEFVLTSNGVGRVLRIEELATTTQEFSVGFGAHIETPLTPRVDEVDVQAIKIVNREGTLQYYRLDKYEGDVSQEDFTEELPWELIPQATIYKSQQTLVINTTNDVSMCLPTKRKHAFCATNDDVKLITREGVVQPTTRFGLVFNDSALPAQTSGSYLVPMGGFENPNHVQFSFQKPQVSDLSGVIVYCRFPEQEHFTLYSRIPADAIESMHSVSLSACGEQVFVGEPGSRYEVKVNSFDFGANENVQETSCNTASFTFPQEDDNVWSVVAQAAFGDWYSLYQSYQEFESLREAFGDWSQAATCNPLDG